MFKISVKVIPHGKQRYETVGDWSFDKNDNLNVFVSYMGNNSYEYLVADHEIREAMACRRFGINEKDVSDFDIKFEKERRRGKHPKTAEPGDDPKAPYAEHHFFATTVERLTAQHLGIDWKAYDDTVMSL